MAIDLKAEMAKLVARKGQVIAEYQGPDLLLEKVVHHGDFDDFKEFFTRYAKSGRRWKNFNLQECDSIFGPRWMARFEPAHLRWIYHLLAANDPMLKYTAKLIANRRIAAERRALCFHAVFAADTHSNTSFGVTIRPYLWWYNRSAWESCVLSAKRDSEDAFVRRLACARNPNYSMSVAMFSAATFDTVSVFEMNREFDNRQICDSLLQFLIRSNAAKCFAYLLAKYPNRVFKLRSPEEWVLTVCRCAGDELAATAVNELERQFPGLVAATRDPWGGNALWSTFCELGTKEKLRAELIRLGCDPDEENDWGLSPRLLLENSPAAC